MIYYVYQITNKINNKIYIGKRKYKGENPLLDSYMGSGKLIKEAIKKYGKNTIHLFVRKIFGHFGAFMVCSFFALMTMIFFLKNNYLRFGLAFLNGVFLAVLTEFIQYNTIGRYGTIKDVCIDLAGYSSMMIIIGVIMIIIYLVRKGKRNDEKKYI